jgi:hypothetical protein
MDITYPRRQIELPSLFVNVFLDSFFTAFDGFSSFSFFDCVKIIAGGRWLHHIFAHFVVSKINTHISN